MNAVRKANVVLLYLRRNGYSDSANTLWLMLLIANHQGTVRQAMLAWLNGTGSIKPVLNKTEFLFNGIELINIKIGFNTLNKLLAVLPKDETNETCN